MYNFEVWDFFGKGYDIRGLFCFSLSDECNEIVNHLVNVNDESNVWHHDFVIIISVV
jgi:hypothetical protein